MSVSVHFSCSKAQIFALLVLSAILKEVPEVKCLIDIKECHIATRNRLTRVITVHKSARAWLVFLKEEVQCCLHIIRDAQVYKVECICWEPN